MTRFRLPSQATLLAGATLLGASPVLLGCSGTIGDGPTESSFAWNAGATNAEAANVSDLTGEAGSPADSPGLDGDETQDEDPVEEGFSPAQFDLRGEPMYLRAVPLSNLQWARSVRDVLSLAELPSQAQSFLEPPSGFTLFPNNERVLEISSAQSGSYTLAAAEIATEVAASPEGLTAIGLGRDPDSFVRGLGRRAFRRPLTEEEFTRYRAAFDVGAGLGGSGDAFAKGASVVIEALLQSPHFLYRTELGAEGEPLTGYEVAAKLALWLSNATPSDALLDRAERGELDSPEGVATVAAELLELPEATDVAVEMFAEMFAFARYRNIVKTTAEYDSAMATEAEEVARLFFGRIFETDAGLKEVLTSREGFVGPELAPLYALAPRSSIELETLPAERVGFFSQVPYLMLFGNDTHSDAIHRGLFINFEVLCAQLPEPNIAFPEPQPGKPGQSDRDYVEELTGFGTCGAACHGSYINPLGYAFENFDGLGRLRTMDAGQPVNTASAYPFSSGTQTFDGVPDLMNILIEGEEAHRCFAKNVASYGLQRDIVATDQVLLEDLTSLSRSDSGSMKKVIVELVKSPPFRTREEATP